MTGGPMASAVATALEGAKLEPRDAAARALAEQYAALIDEAAPKATYDDALRTLAEAVGAQPEAVKALRKVATALAAHSVASDLGPKLLATLLALGMAPAGRGAVKGGGQVGPVAGKLDELRARRERRDAAR